MATSLKTEIGREFEAGHCGKDVRSDLRVGFESRDSGDLEISVESRVKPYYGEAITAQARQVLEQLGVKNARLTIRDEGALPFVIAARIEAAVRRAGLAHGRRAKKLLLLLLPLVIASAARGFTCRAASPSITSMPPCMDRTP